MLRIRDLGLVGTDSVFTGVQKYASCLEMWVFYESKLDLDLAVTFVGGNTVNTSSKFHRSFVGGNAEGIVCADLKLHTRV